MLYIVLISIFLRLFQAFSSLAEAAYDAAVLESTEESEPATYCLSSYFEPIVQKLLETTDRYVSLAGLQINKVKFKIIEI